MVPTSLLSPGRESFSSSYQMMSADSSDNPALQCKELWSSQFNWIAGAPPSGIQEGMDVLAQVRHRMRPVHARVRLDGDQ